MSLARGIYFTVYLLYYVLSDEFISRNLVSFYIICYYFYYE